MSSEEVPELKDDATRKPNRGRFPSMSRTKKDENQNEIKSIFHKFFDKMKGKPHEDLSRSHEDFFRSREAPANLTASKSHDDLFSLVGSNPMARPKSGEISVTDQRRMSSEIQKAMAIKEANEKLKSEMNEQSKESPPSSSSFPPPTSDEPEGRDRGRTLRPAPPPASSNSFGRQLPLMDRSNRDLKIFEADILTSTYLTKLNLSKNQIPEIPAEINQLTSLNLLDLSFNRLCILPNEISELVNLTDANFSGNTISIFPKKMEQLEALTKLELTSNKLQNFPIELTTLPNLATLYIHRNSIAYLPHELRQLTSLTDLNLSENKLKNLAYLGNLTSLQILNLNQNKLESLPEDFGNLINLVDLDISFNQLGSLPDSFYNLAYLTKLNLKKNKINRLLPSLFEEVLDEQGNLIGGLISLQELILAQNEISSVPEGLYNLTNLQVLDLTRNSVEEISPKIGNLKNLMKIHLGFNKLSQIPAEIGSLSYLDTLNVFGNRLKSLPSELTALASLLQLFVAYNQIESLPLSESPEFLEWESLEELFLSGNPLQTLSPAIGNLWNLKIVHASYTGIAEIPSTVSYLTNLSTLDLAGNQMSSLPVEFGLLTDLQRLSLKENKFTSLQEEVFENSNLLELDLCQNQLSEVPSRLNELLERDVEIYVDHNPIVRLPKQARDPVQDSSRFKVGWSEMTGRRPTMEDAFIMKGSYLGRTDLDLFGLLDGHAGSAAARYGAKHLPNILESKLKEDDFKNPLLALKKTFPQLNEAFKIHIKDSDISVKHSGATALAALIMDKRIYVANLGDTRAVLCRNGRALRLSLDHKPADEEDRIKALGGWVIGDSTRRVNGLLAVSRSIGDFFMHPFVIDEPFTAEYDIQTDDEFLILACDGVWDEINDQLAVDICRTESDPFKAATKLRDFAYLLDSDDNISVIVVKLKS